MAITVNIYYTGVNGNAKKFAEEMVSSGIVSDIRDLHMKVERYMPDDGGVPETDKAFIKE